MTIIAAPQERVTALAVAGRIRAAVPTTRSVHEQFGGYFCLPAVGKRHCGA